MNHRIKANGAICDRCNRDKPLATFATYRAGDWEYVCRECMTPAEIASAKEGERVTKEIQCPN